MTEQASPPEPVQPVSASALRALLEVSLPGAQADEAHAEADAEDSASSAARGRELVPLAEDERLLDEVAAFLALARGAGEPGPESWLYRPPRVASPRDVRDRSVSAG